MWRQGRVKEQRLTLMLRLGLAVVHSLARPILLALLQVMLRQSSTVIPDARISV